MLKRMLALAAVFVLLFCAVPAPGAYAAGAVTLKEQPASDPDEIRIVKESSGVTITDGEAIFKVDFFPNTAWSGSPARTWYYKTANGETKLGNRTYLLDEYGGQKSSPLYENALGMPTLPLGTLRITEVQAPEGYLRSDFVLDGKIIQPSTGGDATFQWVTQADGTIRYVEDAACVHNDQIKGNLKIIKKDAFEEIVLSGAGFRVLDAEGKTVSEGYTDQNGELLLENIPYGKDYTIQEFRPPMGFKLDETKYPLAVTENGVTITKELTNLRREGTIQVTKKGPDGNVLSGAAFMLEFSTDKGSHWKPVTYREAGDEVPRGGCTSPGLKDGQLTTGEDGKVIFTGLRADSRILYRLTETKAPEGMALIGGSLYVGTLPVESDDFYANDAEVFDTKAYVYTLYVTATDTSVFRLPDAGGGGFKALPLFMLAAALPAVIITFTKKRRKGECE